MTSPTDQSAQLVDANHTGYEPDEQPKCHQVPKEVTSADPQVLREALTRESRERRRAECRADIQMEVVKLAVDLLVREPDIEGFFGGLTKTMVEESGSHTCAVWLLDDDAQRCKLWLAYVGDRLFVPLKSGAPPCGSTDNDEESLSLRLHVGPPFWLHGGMASDHRGTRETMADCPNSCGSSLLRMGWDTVLATPLLLGSRNLGWMTVSSSRTTEPESHWWRIVLIEAIARQAALALHHSRLVDLNLREERRKAILEERNRLARDIHDNLAQGFAAILMQLQGAQREAGSMPPAVASSIHTAVDLARTHLTEARRSVGALRPNVGNGEDIGTALKRLADLGQRTRRVSRSKSRWTSFLDSATASNAKSWRSRRKR